MACFRAMNASTRPASLRILIYLFPALIDMVVAQFLFINTVRIVRMGASAATSAGVTTAWSLAYLLACFLAGRLATPRNSANWMIFSCVSLTAMATLGLFLPGITAIYVVTGLAGAAAAFFFPPFQLFMKAVDQGDNKSLAYSTGLYTFSWSAGYAIAPLISGVLMATGTNGWRLALASSACAAALTTYGIVRLKHLAKPDSEPADERTPKPRAAAPNPYAGMPDLAWLGWLGAGAGMLAISVIRAVFPGHAVNTLKIEDTPLGTLFFLLSMAQAITGLVLCKSRIWMYRALPVCAAGTLGVIAMVCLALGTSMVPLAVGAILFGIYSGSFFFYMVFHAIAHPARAPIYVAINEAVVGACGIIAPIVGGLLADRAGFFASATACAAIITAITLFQAFIHRKQPAP
jgi:MFS family permease